MFFPRTAIFSRTDSIGDVMLTLPMIGVFKEYFPSCKIVFLGKKYTRPIASACKNIDEFFDWDELSVLPSAEKKAIFKSLKADVIFHVFPDSAIAYLAWQAGIPLRIGTSHRIFHWLSCNKLIHFSRKNSLLHEAQLNLKLLEPFSEKRETVPLSALINYYGLVIEKQPGEFIHLADKNRFNLILHPKSKGSAREWGLENFQALIHLLPAEKFKLFITGTKEEGKGMSAFLAANPSVTDLTGRFSLEELIRFMDVADGIVAASTGPLHLGAALGKMAIGIYAPMRPIHPGRWAPVGKNAHALVLDKNCNDCKKTKDCHCIRSIAPKDVADKLLSGC